MPSGWYIGRLLEGAILEVPLFFIFSGVQFQRDGSPKTAGTFTDPCSFYNLSGALGKSQRHFRVFIKGLESWR